MTFFFFDNRNKQIKLKYIIENLRKLIFWYRKFRKWKIRKLNYEENGKSYIMEKI